MATNLEKYREELKKLIELGDRMLTDLHARDLARRNPKDKEIAKQLEVVQAKVGGLFEKEYQRWYTEASSVIAQLLPDRVAEFRSLYEADPKRKDVTISSFRIRDWVLGMRAGVNRATKEKIFDDLAAVAMRFSTQVEIAKAAQLRFDSKLMDLQGLVRADLFDSELEAARDLLRAGFLRPSGVVAGVLLESHLRQVCDDHKVKVSKKNPTIGDLNDLLKNASVYDTAAWRNIQRLGDLRNLCGHKRDREPTKDDVVELLDGVDKTMKTIL